MYKKRISRNEKIRTTESPRTKTRKLLKHFPTKETKRCIFMYNVILDQLRQKYNDKSKKEKTNLSHILSGGVLRKYKLKTRVHKLIGINTKKAENTTKNATENREYRTLTKRMFERVKAFYTRNDNSRLISGKRQTKTQKGAKKQRRVLLHNLKILYSKFISETKTTISYTSFCRMRPFYVVFPRQSDRDTCMCKTCNNSELMAEALANAQAIKTHDLDTLINQTVCNANEKSCMYKSCNECTEKRIESNSSVSESEVTWFEWKTKLEKREIKQSGKTIVKCVAITVKEQLVGSIQNLLDKFEDQLERYKQHLFRCRSQYNYYKHRVENLSGSECILNIDFSENFVCKYAKEIQAVHFGASKKQISLHTGVTHLLQNNVQTSKTFCTVSDSLNHSPAAIWSHLKPILQQIRSDNPHITSIEIFSDGPATQYRQKANFYLASINPRDIGFETMKWSFFESGHGKGTPDAVGGSVKRLADDCVKYGRDIQSGSDLVNVLKDKTRTEMYFIPEQNISDENDNLDGVKLKAVPGTLKIHQFQSVKPREIVYRDLSCECEIGSVHSGHEFKHANVVLNSDTDKQNQTYAEQSNTIQEQHSETAHNTGKDTNRKRKWPTEDNNIDANEKKRSLSGQLVVDFSNSNCRRIKSRGNSSSKRKRNIRISKRKCKNKNQLKSEIKYNTVLNDLHKCRSFDQLKAECEKNDIQALNVNPNEVNLQFKNLDVDLNAIEDIPGDVPHEYDIYPCEVKSDGNCLPSCGSVFAYKTIEHCDELRVRIIEELVKNEECYLDNTFLSKGLNDVDESRNLTLSYCQYSEYYIPGLPLNNEEVKSIYQKEILSITEDKSYMGIWQLFALSSVLQTPIYSTYPMKGNANVRKDLNRLILPRQHSNREPVHILWTNTRDDIISENWVPNHFVPLLPLSDNIEKARTADEHVLESSIENETRNSGLESYKATDDRADGEFDMKHKDDMNSETQTKTDCNQSLNDISDDGANVGDDKLDDNCLNILGTKGDCVYDNVNLTQNISSVKSPLQNQPLQTRCESQKPMESVTPSIETQSEESDDSHPNILNKKEDSVHDSSNLTQDISMVKNQIQSTESESDKTTENVFSSKESNTKHKDETETENNYTKRSNDISNENANVEVEKSIEDTNFDDINQYIGKFVLVRYNQRPYPGKVLDVEGSNLEIDCMHQVGRKSNNCFFWPRKIKDINMYEQEDVICVIPQPCVLDKPNQYKVDAKAWESVVGN